MSHPFLLNESKKNIWNKKKMSQSLDFKWQKQKEQKIYSPKSLIWSRGSTVLVLLLVCHFGWQGSAQSAFGGSGSWCCSWGGIQATLVGLRHGQSCPWVGSGVHYYQETVAYLNFCVLELGELVAVVCCGDIFYHLLLELHRTLVCDDAWLLSLASTLWSRSRAEFAPYLISGL